VAVAGNRLTYSLHKKTGFDGIWGLMSFPMLNLQDSRFMGFDLPRN
jgi:hypothetical protein